MTSTALKISVIPQDKVKGSKKTTKADPIHSAQSHKNKKPKIQSPSLSLFSQMLLEAQQSPSNQASQAKLPKNHFASHSSNSQRKAQLIQSQKALLTQNKLKIQSPAPSHEKQNQLREALMIKSDRKTIKDIQKIAQDQNLNLSKLEISQKKARGTKKTSQKEKPAQIAQNANPHKTKAPTKEHLKHKTDAPLSKNAPKPDQIIQNPPLDPNQAQASTQMPQNAQMAKDFTLASLLASKEKEEMPILQDKTEEKKAEKHQDLALNEAKKETQFKIAQSRETLNHFSQRLKEEIANYKPPFTKLSMELNPQELGKLEITLTKKGKELQVSVNANNPHALQAFIQNQSEFKNTLANIGFNAVELNFSQGDSQQKEKREEQHQKGNKNSFEELKETPLATSMEIKMVQYA